MPNLNRRMDATGDLEPDPIDIAVGARIRLRRKQLGVSQSKLAEAIGVTFQQVQKYERGANRVSASTLAKVSGALDCKVADFFGEEADGGDERELFAVLKTPGATDMLQAFARVRDNEARQALIHLTRTMGYTPASGARAVAPAADQRAPQPAYA